MSADLQAAQRAAAALVEAGDPDRFAACQLLDPGARERLLALYALNLEIARAPWAAREPYIAEMRLQWWVDALEALRDTGRVPAHEIGPALAPLRDQAGLMIALAEARRRDCWPEGFADAAAFEVYLAETAGHLAWAAARALGAGAAQEGAVRDAAWGAGLAAYFLAVPELIARGRQPLPDTGAAALEVLAREGLVRIARARAGLRGSAPARAALLAGWQAPGILARATRDPGRVLAGGLAPSEFARRAGLLRAIFFPR